MSGEPTVFMVSPEMERAYKEALDYWNQEAKKMGKKKKATDVRLVGEKGDFATITVERERNIINDRTVEAVPPNPQAIRREALVIAANQHAFAGDTLKTIEAAQQYTAFITDGTVPEPAEVELIKKAEVTS